MSKTVVITGGTKGIGRAIAETFSEAGWKVFVGSRTNSLPAGSALQYVATDVRKRGDHVRLVNAAIQETGSLDCYINCAGISVWRPLAEIDEKFWTDMIQTNLDGVFWGSQAAAAKLKSGGTVINLSSLAGKRGSANNSAYCASKFGVNGITQSLAKELGPRGIRVNAVCPVYVETEMILESLKDPHSPAGGQNVAAYLKNFTQGNAALQRLPKAHEVATACLFLASDAASAITGQCINVDCGVLPQ
jgi:3-oxoacyl-[acyl-carrier protein] reductase/meso-butanediol dehydrogenase/(S,S)-butanediol dehydrogenase/diacetyl reductase